MGKSGAGWKKLHSLDSNLYATMSAVDAQFSACKYLNRINKLKLKSYARVLQKYNK